MLNTLSSVVSTHLFGILLEIPALELIVRRIIAAVSTIPTVKDWLWSAGFLFIFAILSLPIGFQMSFLKLDTSTLSWKLVVRVLGISLILPAITEELFFRVLLLPHPSENTSVLTLWLWSAISLAMFIVYHPLNALTFFPAGRTTFKTAVFLSLAALLGITCTLAYFHSGSIWPPVAIHWLVVVVWLLLLGGYQKLHSLTEGRV